jgi:hypothetical protein
MLDSEPKKSVVIRNPGGQFASGTAGGPGRRALGLSVGEFFRDFLGKPVRGQTKSRPRKMADALYSIASDPNNKQCVAANHLLLTRAYGEVPKELSVTTSMLYMLALLPREAKDYILSLLEEADQTYFLAEENEEE